MPPVSDESPVSDEPPVVSDEPPVVPDELPVVPDEPSVPDLNITPAAATSNLGIYFFPFKV